MSNSIIIDLFQNIAILLAFSLLYNYLWAPGKNTQNFFYKLGAGVITGGVGIILILTPWTYKAGIIFDTRSIILAVTGLFFGIIPSLVSIIIVSIYRITLGGQGVYMGVAVIILSGTTGILWRHLRPHWKQKNQLLELISLGILVHVLMLLCVQLLPIDVRHDTLKNIILPVLIIYPIATVLLGKLMIQQTKNWENITALDISEKRWQFALEGAGDGVWDWNVITNEVFYSNRWKSMLGYDDADITNIFASWENLIHPDDRDYTLKQVEKLILNQVDLYEAEYRLLCKNGSYKWILAKGKVLVRDKSNNPIRCIGTHKDISERKEKELQLAYERVLLDSLLNFTPESIYFKDLDSKFIRINQVAAENLGCKNKEDAIGKSDFDFYDFEFATKSFNIEQEIIRTGNLYHAEELGQSKNGVDKCGITNKMPLRNAEGEIIGTFGLSIDITDRKVAEQALTESESYTNSILKAIPDLIFIFDSNGVYLDFKTGNQQDLAAPEDRFLNKNIFDVLPETPALLIKNKIDQVIRTQTASSVEYQIEIAEKKNDFECFIIPFGEAKVIAMVRNISERKKVEVELKNSQEQLKNFAAHLQSVREEERIMLAREIHDELGQILIAMKIDIGIIKQHVIKSIDKKVIEDVTSKFEQLNKLIDNTITTTRKIMTGLRSEALELLGFRESAQLYILEFTERHQIACTFESTNNELNIDSQQSIALFRILQEALTNIAKHAKATEVEISLSIVNDKLIMRISDNGIGFDKHKKLRSDSYGLIGMKERAYLIDSKLSITGQPGKGTVLLLEMPYMNKD
jgi:PAS domain S-box-containing protein